MKLTLAAVVLGRLTGGGVTQVLETGELVTPALDTGELVSLTAPV